MHGHTLKTVMYLGLEPPPPKAGERILHVPVIRIIPRPPSDDKVIIFFANLPACTHAIFTSKSAVAIFFDYLPLFDHNADALKHLRFAAVGQATAAALRKRGIDPFIVAAVETAEGLCEALRGELHPSHHFCWPHSALSRPVISTFFADNGCRLSDCVFYDTEPHRPPVIPSLEDVDEIIFTSPSTIEGFLRLYGAIPWEKKLAVQGPVTEKQLFLLRDSSSLDTMTPKLN